MYTHMIQCFHKKYIHTSIWISMYYLCLSVFLPLGLPAVCLPVCVSVCLCVCVCACVLGCLCCFFSVSLSLSLSLSPSPSLGKSFKNAGNHSAPNRRHANPPNTPTGCRNAGQEGPLRNQDREICTTSVVYGCGPILFRDLLMTLYA